MGNPVKSFETTFLEVLAEASRRDPLRLTLHSSLLSLVDGDPEALPDLFGELESAYGLYIPASAKSKMQLAADLCLYLKQHTGPDYE
jgi:hypothetical protein